jgi:cytochrome c
MNDFTMKRLKTIFSAGLLLGSISISFAGSSASAQTAPVDGKAVFDKNCSICHTVQPPPKLAPPIIPISSRYHLKFKTKEDGVGHMVAFMKSPDKANAVADPQAITRFGLMPVVSISDSELRAVANWVWDQYTPGSGTGPGSGRGMGRGSQK